MAETLTANYAWTKPEVGASIDVWGGMLNGDLDSIDTIVKGVSNAVPLAASTVPLIDGTASAGVATTWSRADHVHPADTTKAPLASPTFTGVPVAPTATAGTSTTQLATTQFVAASFATTASVSATYAPLASPAFTGTPSAPTPGAGDNDTSIATTAFVQGALPVAASTTPVMDGSAAVGVGTTWARSDHVHPVDTSRYAAANPSGYQTAAQVTAALPVASATTPLINGTAGAGSSGNWSRGDHVHPVDTSRYAASNPSGYQTAAQVTAVIPSASAVSPSMNGAASAGASGSWSRGDHVHPVDTTKLSLSGGTLSGDLQGTTATFSGTTNVGSGTALSAAGRITAGTGYTTRAGIAGGTSNPFNIEWTGTVARLWVDSTLLGSFAYTSDYRTKKDVKPLSSMWEQIKSLNPISYSHRDWTPPWEENSQESKPFFKGDDIEQWGFVAHELQGTLTSSAANGTKDASYLIQSPNPWTMLAALTRALQEAMARIEVLEKQHG